MGSNETVRVQIKIQRRGAPDISIESAVAPSHADWLWDLFDVPPTERAEELVMTAPVSALQLLRPGVQRPS